MKIINSKDFDGRTVLHKCNSRRSFVSFASLSMSLSLSLSLSSWRCRCCCFIPLLYIHPMFYLTSFLAVFENRLEIVKMLLQAGADSLLLDHVGCTALHYAILGLSIARCVRKRQLERRTAVNDRTTDWSNDYQEDTQMFCDCCWTAEAKEWRSTWPTTHYRMRSSFCKLPTRGHANR